MDLMLKFKNWKKIQRDLFQFKKFDGHKFENIISVKNNLFYHNPA